MKIIIVYTDEQFSKPITYTFNLILSILGIEHEILPYSELNTSGVGNSNLVISYGRKKVDIKVDYQVHIYQSKLFSRDYRTLSSMPQCPLKRWNGLPVIYEGNGDIKNFVVKSENLIETNIDIVASSFFMLSRYEEVMLSERDHYDRFPAVVSIAHKGNFLTRPIVNEYIDLFWEWIDSFNLDFKPKTLWKGKDFAVLLTHDVDLIRKYRWWDPPLRSIASSIVKHGQFAQGLRYAWDWAASSVKIKPDPYWTFDYITELEHKYDLTSSFYFMTSGNTKYEINDPKIVKLVKKLEGMGHEVGLHGSSNSYNDCKTFIREKDRLNQFVSKKHYGGRQHMLHWKTPDTWRIYEKADMLYDATLGYADHEGFRCGFCLPFKPFDVLEDRVIDIWELPLTVMEGTLQRYRGLSPKRAYKSIRALLDVIIKHHGLFVMLWHNSHLYELMFPGWKRLYERLMSEIGSKTIFSESGRNIIYHWVEDV